MVGCAPAGARALAKGDRLLKEKKYPEAVQKFEEATTAFPKNAEAWNHLAVGYQYAGNLKKSASAFQKALSLNPNLTAARRNLGLLYFEQRNFSAALLELTTFTQLEQKNAEGWFYRGLAEMQLARTSPPLEKVRQFESAKRSLDYSQKLHPSAETLNLTGLLQVQRGRVREAIPFFTAALQQQPDFSPAILNLAVTHQHLNERKRALDFYKKFLSIARQAPETSQVHRAIQQLESELTPVKNDPAPARIVATNPTPTIANKPVVASNAPPAPRTETNFTKPLVAARQPTILSSPKAQPLPQKEIPVVVATLPEEPLIKPAGNVIDEVQTAPERSNETNPAADSVRVAIPPAEKGAGVLTRLNPTTWFRRKPKYTPLTTQLPGEKSSIEKPAPTEVID
ncbi:MAG: tetratricopeptide repeat protein, partial [Verrucomicrobiota bacterium]